LFQPLYSAATTWGDQPWDTYRATTTLGHPEVNGLVFAAAAVLALSEWLKQTARSSLAITRLILLLGALVASGTRGAMVAFGVGAVTVVIATRLPQRLQRRRLVGVLILVIVVGASVSAILARSATPEGRTSARGRLDVPAQTVAAMRDTSLLGAGPGQSERYRASKLFDTRYALESSYAGLAVSVGLVGLLLFLATVGVYVALGFRTFESSGEAAALLTILLAAATFNLVDSVPGMLILMSMFMLSISAMDRSPHRTWSRSPASRHLEPLMITTRVR
jgi:O-antigen ligase